MKISKLLLSFGLLILGLATHAQVGIGTNTPAASAQLEVSSTTKGFLPPRMLASERTAIGSPVAGLMVYQTDGTKGLYYYDGSSWIFIIQTNITGNAGSATNLVAGVAGAVPYQSASNTTSFTAAGSNGQVLTVAGGFPTWAAASSSGVPYSGATGAVNLGAYDLSVNGVTVGRGSYTATFPPNNNTAIGNYGLFKNTSGKDNTVIGDYALWNNTTGGSNTSIGSNAGSTNTTGTNNTVIGNLADVATNNLTNATAIGNYARVAADNTVQLGNTSVTNVKTSGTLTAGGVTYPNTAGTNGYYLKTDGSGTATWAAVSGGTATSINGTNLSGLATGILKNTTSTGVPSIAVASDFPTLNQNTTGNAATATNLTGLTATVATLNNVSNTNSGDETAATIKTKLGVTTLSGSNTGDQTTITGNAGSATNLAAGAAGSLPYQSSANTTIFLNKGTDGQILTLASGVPSWATASSGAAAAGTITGTTLAANVVNSSLTSVGTLTSATISGKGIIGATSAASSSAILEASSTTQGFLPPRMTAAQRNLINSPAQGLMVYCTNCGTNGEPEYYNGAGWVNLAGGATATATSGSTTPTTPPTTVSIGSSYQGGTVAYILVSGDPGYDAAVQHGLIVANVDQNSGAGIPWCNGGVTTTTNATGTAIGTGFANTNLIIASQGAGTNYAAAAARNYQGGGYTDWYLPSKDELNKLFLNRVAIGSLNLTVGYHTSTEGGAATAWGQYFGNGITGNNPKCVGSGGFPGDNVRAIRSF